MRLSSLISSKHWLYQSTLIVLAIALLAWPFDTIVPGAGGEWGWVGGVMVITEKGPDFGRDVVWNYGPLGFMNNSGGVLLYYDTITQVTFVYQWALQILLVATMLIAARRSYALPVAALITFLVISTVSSRSLALGFAWCVLAFTAPSAESQLWRSFTRWFPLLVGLLAGFLLLGKLNLGLTFLVLAGVTLVFRPEKHKYDIVKFIGGLAVTASIGWFATGQTLGDVWPYLRYGFEIISGYPAAAGSPYPPGHEHYWAAVFVFALVSAMVWNAAREMARVQRVGFALLWLIYAYMGFKAGFVRHDPPHVLLFFEAMLIALAVLPIGLSRRWFVVSGAGIAVCLIICSVIGVGFRPEKDLNPYRNLQQALEQTYTLASTSRKDQIRADHFAAIRRHYAFPESLAELIADRTVTFWPYARGDLAYALSLDWQPTPLIEPYNTSTQALDELVADDLASSSPSRLIIRTPRPVSDPISMDELRSSELISRVPPMEPPLAARTILCDFRELTREEVNWQVLARSSNRCGGLMGRRVVSAPWGQTVDVPEVRSNSALLLRVEGIEPVGSEILEALWLRPDPRVMLLDGRPYRIAPSSAANPYLLSVSPEVDYSPPLEMAPDPATVAVASIGSQPGGELRYTFLELPIQDAPYSSISTALRRAPATLAAP